MAEATYNYDDHGQLILERNRAANACYGYTYDAYGNITEVKEGTYSGLPANTVKSFSYSGDRLVRYDGSQIGYDAVGNPNYFTYDDTAYTLSWEDGRRLSSTTVNFVTTDYKYNLDGVRTQKGDIQYIVDGTRILAEKRSDRTIYYIYDESGSPVGFTQKLASGAVEAFYYVKNLQGDITELLDYKLDTVAVYSYNAWGEILSVTDSSGNEITDESHIANINPIRYRGYYYDTETGFYYCGSRYYNPVFCRWINADDTGVLQEDQDNILQYNLYAYCFNNPVNMVDDDGYLPKWITKVAIGVGSILVGATVVAATAATGGVATAFVGAALAGVKAAAISGTIGAVVGAGTSAVSYRVSNGSWSGSGKATLNGAINGFSSGFMSGGIMSAGSQIVSSGFTVAAKISVNSGKPVSRGIELSKNIKVLSPDKLYHKTNGGTLLKIGNTFRIDVNSSTMLHTHFPGPYATMHFPIGTIGAGLYGGIMR